MQFNRFIGLVVAAAAAAMSGTVSAFTAPARPRGTPATVLRAKTGLGVGNKSAGRGTRADRRAATKRRNVIRNRRAQR